MPEHTHPHGADDQARVVIEMEHVSFAYNAVPVLEDVNLKVVEREFIGIIGPNGGGKTTLLRLILGLLQPGTGRILVFGRPPARAASMLGYVPQHMQFDRDFPVSVLDVVLMSLAGRAGLGPYRRRHLRAAEEALDTVELLHYRDRPFAGLSGGQRQRVLIARALAADPRMLLFDEPTANVDTSAGEKLYQILARLNRKMTILVVSHDIGFVHQYITSVVCVNRRVRIHPTSALDGRNITELYGEDMSLIRHDHRCSREGHTCLNS
ncbi:MAG TPA: ATP-binding cassette domain-containing protein [Desulfobulbus sp.]|nr:ATP-binding cassette domain-containing protein [Desulfobulbus sp.]